MTRIIIRTIGLPALFAAAMFSAPFAAAQTPQAPALPQTPVAQTPAPQAAPKPPTAAELILQLADTQAKLERQTLIASNARSEVEKLRGELKLREELLAVGVARNAELASIAGKIAEKGLSNNGIDPFVQAQRVEMENLRQSYEDQLRAARIYPETLPPSVQKQMDEDLASKKDAAS